MLYRKLLGSSALVTAALAGVTAQADVTPSDVWANQVAYYEATGAIISGQPVVTGDTLTVDAPELVYVLPFGAGSLTVTLPPVAYVGNSDGTVTLTSLNDFDVTATIIIAGEDPVGATINVTQSDTSAVASGDPGDVTYTYTSGPFAVTLTDLQQPEPDLIVTGSGTGEGYAATSRVTVGELVTVVSSSTVQPINVVYDVAIGGDGTITSETTYGVTTNESTMTLVAGGTDILNLTPAFAAGMSIALTTTMESSQSKDVTTLNGAVVSEISTDAGGSTASIALSAAGLVLDFIAGEVLADIQQPDIIPFPIQFEATGASGGYTFPIMADAAPQDFGFRLSMEGLRVNAGLWELIDPGKELPRDPINLGIDVSGTTISDVDLFDFMALEQKFAGALPPVSLETLKINDLSLAAIGASLTGSADMVFDNTDLATYDGFPRPIGDAYLAVSGANAVLDRLQAIGAIGPDEASGARLGMGFIARSTGDDSFETNVEFNEEGHLSVNGQRIR